jgi:hypothetical protein
MNPLLEKLDRFFTSASWTLSYPSSLVYSIVKTIFDHLPCLIAFDTKIPRANIFRFENYWLQHSDFLQIVQNAWNIPVNQSNSAKRVNAKLKILRRAIRLWSKNLPCLKNLIKSVNDVIELLDNFEEMRNLSVEENCLRDLLKSHVLILLKNQNIYWKQRGKIKWVKLGDENTKFFHTVATQSYRKKSYFFTHNRGWFYCQ